MEDTTYITFDKYLNNELSKKELISFENRLETDAEFQEEFNIYKALESSLTSTYENAAAEAKLRNTLIELGEKFIKEEARKKETKVIPLINYRKLMVAASIALLIGFFIFKDGGTPAYNDFSNHQTLELVVRSDQNEAFSKAEKAFNSKNYEEALTQLTILSNTHPNDAEIELYKGISQLELNEFKVADTTFDDISKGNSSFATTALWYKALSLLKQEKLDECKQVLETIPESAEEYEQAQKLLDKL